MLVAIRSTILMLDRETKYVKRKKNPRPQDRFQAADKRPRENREPNPRRQIQKHKRRIPPSLSRVCNKTTGDINL
jgi:hypothetical protein